MLTQNLATITKRWTRRFGFLWLRKETVEVTAQQVAVPQDKLGFTATGKLTITVNGKTAHEVDLPWAMPRGEIILPLMVYMLSQMPEYEHPQWQPVMERFCDLCEGFSRPEKLFWSREPIDL